MKPLLKALICAIAALTQADMPPDAESDCRWAVKVAGFSSSDYPANNPIEDRHYLKEGTIFHATVFDGHGGFDMVEHAKGALPGHVQTQLSSLPEGAEDDQVGEALKRAFEATEESWVKHFWGLVKKDKGLAERRATMGACTLSALIRDAKVFIANAGDCRAVLGRRRGQEWRGMPLSFDHNAREPREQRALEKEHPNEADLVVKYGNGVAYVKGRLQPTRSLGDLHLKLPELGPMAARAAGQWTAPYVKATPEVSVTDLDSKDRFLVLGSDGLWDNFNNSEVAALVGQALDRNETTSLASMLVEKTLERVAERYGVTVDMVKGLRPGTPRRNIHDDITAVVIVLEVTGHGNGCAALEARADDVEDGEKNEYWVFESQGEGTAEEHQPQDEL